MPDEEPVPVVEIKQEPNDDQSEGEVIVIDSTKDAQARAKKKTESKQKSEAEIQAEKLDKEFNELLKKFCALMKSFTLREATIATEWMAKLKNCGETLEDRKLRIRFLKYFLESIQSKDCIFKRHPFKNIPPNFSAPLIELQRLLPKSPDEALNPTEEEKASYMAELFANLPDKGKFLAAQPVPRNGTFYIIVTAQVPDNCNAK